MSCLSKLARIANLVQIQGERCTLSMSLMERSPSIPMQRTAMWTATSNECPRGDAFCQGMSGDPSSYCKYWDPAFPPRCQYSDSRCNCSCTGGNAICRKQFGADSFCNFWKPPPSNVCEGAEPGVKPCDCPLWVPPPPPPSPCEHGDAYCIGMTGNPGSYCKYWDPKPTCQYNPIPCNCNCSGPMVSSGDKLCKKEFGPASYCKFWKPPPANVCQGSTKQCSCSWMHGGSAMSNMTERWSMFYSRQSAPP